MKNFANFSLNVRDAAKGVVAMPGSKSISNRLILLSALSNGRIKILNFLESEDTEVMLGIIKKMGVKSTLLNSANCSLVNNDEQPTLMIDGIGENLNKIFNTKNEMNFFCW